MSTGTRRRLLTLALIALGLTISLYLLLRYFALHANPAIQGTGFCSTVLKMDCDSSLLSNMSKQFGIPVAGWGVVYYVTLASLLVLGHVLGKSFDPEATLGALVMAIAGACGSITLAVIIMTGLAPFCPLCMATHVVNIALLFALWRLAGNTMGQSIRMLAAAGSFLIGRSDEADFQPKWKCVGFLTTALIAVTLYQCILFQTEKRPVIRINPTQVLADYAFTPPQEIPIDSDDPRLGNGPVQLVMFSSFECPGCKIVSQYLHQLNETYAGKLQIVFKHFPLGKACNPAVEQEVHPHACAAAWAAEAAKRENAFWPFHDALLATNLSEPNDPISRVARDTGLALRQFDELRKAEATRSKVQQDIELGRHLGVMGTPTIFINGRKLTYVDPWAIELVLTAVINIPQIEVAPSRASSVQSFAASE